LFAFESLTTRPPDLLARTLEAPYNFLNIAAIQLLRING